MNPRDIALARSSVLKLADFAPGWRRRASAPDDNEPKRCPSWNPDFSAFTITGKATADFEDRQAGVFILSAVKVYASTRQAVGYFRAGAKPGLARCIRSRASRRGGAGVKLTVVSSRMVPSPPVGDQSATYRLVARGHSGATSVTLHYDFHYFQRGRSFASLAFVGIGARAPDQLVLLRILAARLR